MQATAAVRELYPKEPQYEEHTGRYRNVSALQAHIEMLEQAQADLPEKERKNVRQQIAKGLRVSQTVLSQYLNEKYPGKVEKVDEAVDVYLAAYTEVARYQWPQQAGIIVTEQMRQGFEVIEFAARHRTLTMISGESGIGKSKTLETYAQEHPEALYIKLRRTKRTLKALLRCMWQAIPTLRRQNITYKTSDDLLDGLVEYFEGGSEILLIDEAQYLNYDALNGIRDLQEDSGLAIVLSGTFELDDRLGYGDEPVHPKRTAALHRRIVMHRELPASIQVEDVAALADQYHVNGAAEIAWLHQQCNRPGRRYGWLDIILREAGHAVLDLREAGHHVPITLDLLGSIAATLEGVNR
jgi:hypothetical protein